MSDTPVVLDKKQDVNQSLDKTFLSPDYEYPKNRITQLVNSFDFEFKATDYRRRARNITVNVADLRTQGKIKPDETIIPIRLIDTNIKREEPAKLAYLKQSRRLAIFKAKNVAKPVNVQYLEEEFTRVCQYQGWEVDFIRAIDGSATHGWDSIEIIFDPKLPGGFCFDQIGHENLIFPLDSKSLEASEFVIRIRQVTVTQLRNFVKKYKFDETQVQFVIDSTQPVRQSNSISVQSVPTEDSLREIYKVFFKQDGTVYVGWYAKEANNWLKLPEKLFLGKKKLVTNVVEKMVPMKTGVTSFGAPIIENIPQQVPETTWEIVYETSFPIKLLLYEENEQPQIKDRKGRVYKDDYKQEALLALWSSFINGCIRASNVHAAPKNPATGGAPKQTNVIIEHGKLWSEPIDFFNTPWPDPMILTAAQALDVQNTQETLQLSAAVSNRQDSRKTAQEIKQVQQEQSLVNGVQVTLLSVFLRDILTAVWQIVQSQALQELIVFCSQNVGGGEFKNDLELIGEDYDIFAAGDVDVVQRAEKLQKQLQFLPIVGNTALGEEFLVDIIKSAFPDEANRYETILRNGFQQGKIIQQQQQEKQQQQEQMMQQGVMAQGMVNMKRELSVADKNTASAMKDKMEAALAPKEMEQNDQLSNNA